MVATGGQQPGPVTLGAPQSQYPSVAPVYPQQTPYAPPAPSNVYPPNFGNTPAYLPPPNFGPGYPRQ